MLQAEKNIAISAVLSALRTLEDLPKEIKFFDYDRDVPREMKAASDRILEEAILSKLKATGIDILSEETGFIAGERGQLLNWVVDPLDGTVNYIRGLAPCAVSIALCRGGSPLWGVIGEFPSGNISYGGIEDGAISSGKPIRVSSVIDRNHAVICSGFPSRFEFNEQGMKWIFDRLSAFGKVRMVGSASLSLLHVAKGAAEAYAEKNIMLWDVAAGLAILQGAGGITSIVEGDKQNSYDVYASNGLIMEDIRE